MPFKSERKKDIDEFEFRMEELSNDWLYFYLLDMNEEMQEVDDDIEAIEETLDIIRNERYYHRKSTYSLMKNYQFQQSFWNFDERNLRQIIRMNRSTFIYLLTQIKDNPIFHNKSNNPQKPIYIQLALTLERLGTFGRFLKF